MQNALTDDRSVQRRPDAAAGRGERDDDIAALISAVAELASMQARQHLAVSEAIGLIHETAGLLLDLVEPAAVPPAPDTDAGLARTRQIVRHLDRLRSDSRDIRAAAARARAAAASARQLHTS